jgi:hypothetical protein
MILLRQQAVAHLFLVLFLLTAAGTAQEDCHLVLNILRQPEVVPAAAVLGM